MIVSGYTLDHYCDNIEDVHKHPYGLYDNINHISFPIEYTYDGIDCYSVTRKMAKKDGWLFKRNGTVLCPLCSKK